MLLQFQIFFFFTASIVKENAHFLCAPWNKLGTYLKSFEQMFICPHVVAFMLFLKLLVLFLIAIAVVVVMIVKNLIIKNTL